MHLCFDKQYYKSHENIEFTRFLYHENKLGLE